MAANVNIITARRDDVSEFRCKRSASRRVRQAVETQDDRQLERHSTRVWINRAVEAGFGGSHREAWTMAPTSRFWAVILTLVIR